MLEFFFSFSLTRNKEITIHQGILYVDFICILCPCPTERYFTCKWMVGQSCSIAQNLVVNYHLVVSFPQQDHIAINVNH